MDAAEVAQQMRLDLAAFHASQTLTAKGIEHVLLKGPTTAKWLYDPPRRYNDVDLLVAGSRRRAAVRALAAAGVARPLGGRLGDEGAHGQVLISSAGFEIDLHVALPELLPGHHADEVFRDALARAVPWELPGIGAVPALDEVGRCVVVALHAVGTDRPQAHEDLRRAREQLAPEIWAEAANLASRWGVREIFVAALDPQQAAVIGSSRVTQEGSAALALERLTSGSFVDRVSFGFRKAAPSSVTLFRTYPDLAGQRLGLLRAHARRWRRIAKALPDGFRAWRSARQR